MKIIPLAFDSLGTRSMATYVETKDCKLVIDPAVALAPKRSGLQPHPIEIKRMQEQWKEIKKYAKAADILAVTHYHYDHYNPHDPELYKGKTLFLKHPAENINKSQKTRSKRFLKDLGDLPKEINYSDGQTFKFGKTRLTFSEAVFHGDNSVFGWVTEVLVDDGKTRLIHTSDVLGPCTDRQTAFILKHKPDILISDGPMYFMLREARKRMRQIIGKAPPKTYIIDHHFLRDAKWRQKLEDIPELAEKKGIRFQCAAEFLGKEPDLLEAKRKQLYSEQPI